MTNINPGPAVSSTVNQATGLTATYNVTGTALVSPTGQAVPIILPTVYTYATLPLATTVANGTIANTNDKGRFISNGINWAVLPITSISGRRAVMIGDSQTLRNNSIAGGVTITAITVPNNTECRVQQATHRVVPGNYVNLAWVNHPLLRGRTVQVSNIGDENNANITTYWRFPNPGIAPGTTISAVPTRTITGTSLCYTKDEGFQAWINAICGNVFDWVQQCCANGQTSTDILSTLPGLFLGPQFDVAFVLTGANDVNGIPLATSKANVLSIVNQLVAYGAKVFLFTPTPVGNTIPGQPALTLPLRNYCIELGKTISGVTTFDLHQWLMDYTSTTDNWLSTYTQDQLHQNPTGAYNAIKGFATDIPSALLPRAAALFPQSAAEDPNVSSYTGGNILFNPMLTGSGGTMTGGTGTVATSWRVINTGLTTCVGTPGVARSDGKPGLYQQVVATGTGNFTFLPTGQTVEARVTGGKWYQFGMELNINGTGLTEINISASATLTDLLSNSPILWVIMFETASDPYLSSLVDTLTVVTEPFFIPTGWTVNATYAPTLKVAMSGGNATIKIARPFMMPVTGL